MYFHDHNCSKCKVRKPHFTRQLTQMIFNHLVQRQRKYGFTTLINSNSKKPDFLVLRNRAFLDTPLKRPSIINEDF